MFPRCRTEIDSVVKDIGMECSHQSDRDVPRTMFRNGVSSFTMITGNACSSVLIVVTMCLICENGKEIVESSGLTEVRIGKYICLLENLLMFEDWMQKETIFDNEVELPMARKKMIVF